MHSTIGLRRGRLAVAAIAIFAVAGGIAFASIPDAAGVIHGCYRTSTDDQKGQLRVVEDPASCRSNETPIQWNEQGVTGPAGPAGADGADGQDGADGSSPTVAQLAAGHPQCPAGGAVITDAAGTTAFVCSGADGADGDQFSGTFTSPNGQFSISVTDTGVTVASPDSAIRVTDSAIKVETMGLDPIELRGAGAVRVESAAALQLKAGSTASLTAAAGLALNGALVTINGPACAPAARVGDVVSGLNIVTGSTTVCIG